MYSFQHCPLCFDLTDISTVFNKNPAKGLKEKGSSRPNVSFLRGFGALLKGLEGPEVGWPGFPRLGVP